MANDGYGPAGSAARAKAEERAKKELEAFGELRTARDRLLVSQDRLRQAERELSLAQSDLHAAHANYGKAKAALDLIHGEMPPLAKEAYDKAMKDGAKSHG
jgi:outer membrane protein TolC